MAKRIKVPSIKLIPPLTALDHIDKLTLMALNDGLLQKYPSLHHRALTLLRELEGIMVDDEELLARENERVVS